MKVVIDIEANGLINPTKVWCIVCKNIDNGKLHIFRNLTEDDDARGVFLTWAKQVDLWIGHNFLGYDWPVLRDLVGLKIDNIAEKSIDTLIVSKLVDYSR